MICPPSPVICIDSGIGGLHIFQRLTETIPASHIYIADYAGFPYGSRTPQALIDRLIHLVESVLDALAQHTTALPLIVLACNTATTVAIQSLRHRFPALSFIGCIPAIKPAALATQTGHIALLATPATCQQQAVDELIGQHAAHTNVLRFPMPTLAQLAEHYATHHTETPDPSWIHTLRTALHPLTQHPLAAHIDQVVLGCTHYRFLLPLLKTFTPSHWNWRDATEGVTQYTTKIWQQLNTSLDLTSHSYPSALPHFLYTTDDSSTQLSLDHTLSAICHRLNFKHLPRLSSWLNLSSHHLANQLSV